MANKGGRSAAALAAFKGRQKKDAAKAEGRPSGKGPGRILGVDPGSLCLGYGIIEGTRNKPVMVSGGTVRNPGNRPFPQRLLHIENEIQKLVEEFSPCRLAIEKAFYQKDAQSTMKLGMVRGVVLLVAERNGLDICEFAPLKIKKTVVGYGLAEKEQVAKMVQMAFRLKEPVKSLDMADALAIALTDMVHG